MGSIRSRKDSGKLFFDFRAGGQRFREQTELDDTPANRKRMQSVTDRIEFDLQSNNFDYARYFPNSPNRHRSLQSSPLAVPAAAAVERTVSAEVVTTPAFRDFAETWYSENEVRWRRTTRGLMRMVVDKHLAPTFADQQVGAISRADVLAFRAEFSKRDGKTKGKPMSPKTVNDVVGVLKSILDEAAARFDFSSPCQKIKRLKVPRTEVFPFTLDEVRKLIDTVRADYRDYMTVRVFTGLRTGEANGLQWEHIDFANREILVRETFTHGQRDQCKTDGSWREVAMSPPVFDALMRHRGDVKNPTGYVFTNTAGEPLDNHNFCNRVWYPLLRLLGFKRRRPYQLRHTAATLWLASGENPTWIARQLGHASVEMLFRTYARWVKNMTQRDGAAFDALLASSLSPASEIQPAEVCDET